MVTGVLKDYKVIAFLEIIHYPFVIIYLNTKFVRLDSVFESLYSK